MSNSMCYDCAEATVNFIGRPRVAAFITYHILILLVRLIMEPLTPMLYVFGWILIDVVMVHNARCISNLLDELKKRDAMRMNVDMMNVRPM